MRKVLIVLMILFFSGGVLAALLAKGGQEKPQPVPPVSQESQPPMQNTIKTVTITAAGDCTLATDENAPRDGSFQNEVKSQNNDYSYFLRNVKPIFEEDDLTIVNFEGTLSTQGTRMDKQFAFRGNPEYVKILTSSSVEAANLSNNHSRDYGAVSREDTIKYLDEAGVINFTGTKTALTEINGVRVGLLGINGLNATERGQLEEAMNSVKAQNPELIIASFHWGQERETAPTKQQKELAHQAIDLGADLVLGHHPHVLQGVEKYKGKYICYSLGNFCFGGNRNPADKDTMLFRQTFTLENGAVRQDDEIDLIPCSISSVPSRNNYQPTPATGAQRERIIQKLTNYSKALGDATLKFREE